jgi:hypothetical protein
VRLDDFVRFYLIVLQKHGGKIVMKMDDADHIILNNRKGTHFPLSYLFLYFFRFQFVSEHLRAGACQ